MQQAGINLTDLEPNIEYRLGLTIYYVIRTHSIQRSIRIHLHVSTITRVRPDVGSGAAYFQYCICNVKGQEKIPSFVRK